jgi:holo-[acyl-carrier protein] synthase
MIIGLGVDSVEVERFTLWRDFTHKTLSRIFSDEEIRHCLQSPKKSAERFAVRFAVREACFKALSGLQSLKKVPFLTLCKAISITKNDGAPYLKINQNFVSFDISGFIFHISLTHTRSYATAVVIIENVSQ